ncbi:hypothetical protein BJY04DRAFT_172249 [Aspergillus karnatakaensis]|uniref:uncharacterized protein n=1 Tax=Aspergillus karnatakaensis TaxID=1810916 RepID=UPI003CCD94A0
MIIRRPAAGSTVDLRSLRSVEGSIHLEGAFLSVNLNSLYNASSLQICNEPCDTTPEWNDAVAQTLDVTLSSLETAEELRIKGNISRYGLASSVLPNIDHIPPEHRDTPSRLQTMIPTGLFV